MRTRRKPSGYPRAHPAPVPPDPGTDTDPAGMGRAKRPVALRGLLRTWPVGRWALSWPRGAAWCPEGTFTKRNRRWLYTVNGSAQSLALQGSCETRGPWVPGGHLPPEGAPAKPRRPGGTPPGTGNSPSNGPSCRPKKPRRLGGTLRLWSFRVLSGNSVGLPGPGVWTAGFLARTPREAGKCRGVGAAPQGCFSCKGRW